MEAANSDTVSLKQNSKYCKKKGRMQSFPKLTQTHQQHCSNQLKLRLQEKRWKKYSGLLYLGKASQQQYKVHYLGRKEKSKLYFFE